MTVQTQNTATTGGYNVLLSMLALVVMAISAYWFYQNGYADPLIEKIGYVVRYDGCSEGE